MLEGSTDCRLLFQKPGQHLISAVPPHSNICDELVMWQSKHRLVSLQGIGGCGASVEEHGNPPDPRNKSSNSCHFQGMLWSEVNSCAKHRMCWYPVSSIATVISDALSVTPTGSFPVSFHSTVAFQMTSAMLAPVSGERRTAGLQKR